MALGASQAAKIGRNNYLILCLEEADSIEVQGSFTLKDSKELTFPMVDLKFKDEFVNNATKYQALEQYGDFRVQLLTK